MAHGSRWEEALLARSVPEAKARKRARLSEGEQIDSQAGWPYHGARYLTT